MSRRRPAWTGLLALALATGACAVDDDEPVPVAATGPVRLHRLNRSEYDNTVRDLLASPLRPAREFPADDPSLGFDNIADALRLSPLQLELYERAAAALVAEALTSAPGRARVLTCERSSRDCAQEVLAGFASRAWRRPIAAQELADLLALYDLGAAEGHELGLSLALQATLMSPRFLFRAERGDELDAYALASRLAYFLWSSMPDDELFAAAAAGALADPEQLAGQVRRMLADPRAAALTDNFAAQWLPIRMLDDVFKDAHRFPGFDEPLRAAMREEMTRFFAGFVADDRDLRELLTASDSAVNAQLAVIYELEGELGDELEPVDLDALPRRGLLTQAGTMAALSHPFTTSPTRRGAWVLGQLLCQPPPPPPPGVDTPLLAEGDSKRERLAKHAADPACAGCHTWMDPIGLAFEHYDAIGRWRGSEKGELIDASGSLPSGEAFLDAVELTAILAEDPAFPRCVLGKAMTYALGRELTPAEAPVLDDLAEQLAERGHGTAELFVLVATSELFRGVRGAP